MSIGQSPGGTQHGVSGGGGVPPEVSMVQQAGRT